MKVIEENLPKGKYNFFRAVPEAKLVSIAVGIKPYVLERSPNGDVANPGRTAFALAKPRFAYNCTHENKVYEVNFKESGAFPRFASPAAPKDIMILCKYTK